MQVELTEEELKALRILVNAEMTRMDLRLVETGLRDPRRQHYRERGDFFHALLAKLQPPEPQP